MLRFFRVIVGSAAVCRSSARPVFSDINGGFCSVKLESRDRPVM